MEKSKLRRQIAWEAARLMYERQEAEYYRAKMKAARRICQGWVKPADLPSNAEIRDEIQAFARVYEGQQRSDNLQAMRLEALRLMIMLERFRPRLIGSVLTGHIRQGSDIDIHVFSDSVESVARALEQNGVMFDLERKHVRKQGQEKTFVHLHVVDRFRGELTIYPADKAHYVFKSSVTGKAMERASINELRQLLAEAYPDMDIDSAVAATDDHVDRFQVFESLLLPLEYVQQNRQYHPEGDALYHSLQVFDLACSELPHDEEFLSAALLHDVGKAIDASDHVGAAIEALDGFVTERTMWLIANHMVGHAFRDGTLGVRARRRLQSHESFEELLLLSECDRAGRQAGVDASELDAALGYLRDLERMTG